MQTAWSCLFFFIATCSVIGHVGQPGGRGIEREIEPDVGHWERVSGHLIVPYTLFLLYFLVCFVTMLLYPVRHWERVSGHLIVTHTLFFLYFLACFDIFFVAMLLLLCYCILSGIGKGSRVT